MTRVRAAPVLALVVGLAVTRAVASPEYVRDESPVPASASELETAIEHAFSAKKLADRFVWRGLKEALEDMPPFLRDTRLTLAPRIYLFDRRNSADDAPSAWAAGGRLTYESGWWENFGLRAAYYDSTEIRSFGGDTGLLAPGPENIHILGEANLRYKIAGTFLDGSEIRLFRQALDLPYLNKHDIRMLPATHEAYTIHRVDSPVDFILGHVTRFKDYDDDEFVSMSEAAGAERDRGLTMAGVRIPITDRLTVGAIDHYGWDTFNTFYAEARFRAELGDDLDLRVSGQFTDQRSVGDELVGDFETRHGAVQVALGWSGLVLRVAGSMTADDAGIRSPWGGKPTYLSIQRLDFDRANEKAFLVGLSFKPEFMARVGLSGFVNVAHGLDAEDPETGDDLPDRTEYDFTLDYKPPKGAFEGLWVRFRCAFLDIERDGETVRDVRLIVNYEIPFL